MLRDELLGLTICRAVGRVDLQRV